MLIDHTKPTKAFPTAAAAAEFAATVIDADAGEYFVVETAPNGKSIVRFYEADGYLISAL